MDGPDGCGMSRPKTGAENEVDDDNEIVGTLEGEPATQPYDNSSLAEESMEGSQDEIDPAWGVLYPMRENWKMVRLTDEVSTFGRSGSNTFPIGEDQAGSRVNAISKVHFVIKRSADGVSLVDKSSNGTFVNNKSVGKGKSRMLESNSTISLSDSKIVNYIYMSTNRDFQRDYPRELRSKYVISKELGSGACGVVKLGFKITGNVSPDYPERLAIKKVDKRKAPLNKGAASDVLNEVKILKAIDHPCIIRLEDVVDTEQYLYIVLELANGGELFDKIVAKTRLNEQEAKLHFYQMVSAIEYLHSKNIAHRDLKPENILLCSDDETKPLIKITDMGLSKLVDMNDTRLKTFCGTPQYLAPEVLMSRIRGDGSYGFEVDNWSLGVILYVMISGCPPFSPERTDKPLVRQVCDGDYSFPPSRWNTISEECIDLIKKLIKVERRKRLTAKEALQHPWLNDEGTKQKVEELIAWGRSMRPQREDDESTFGPPLSIISEPKAVLVNGSSENDKSAANEPPPKKICV